MSSKRKPDSVKKTVKRKKKSDNEGESEGSDTEIISDGGSATAPDEILISGEEYETASKLPDELLATYDKDPGKLIIAGMVTWEMVARRDTGKPKQAKVRPNLFSFHRFTDEKVSVFYFVLKYLYYYGLLLLFMYL